MTPEISIITITYNAGKVLEKTIQSIVNQPFTNYEYLIIDGGSTDETLQIVDKYRSHIHYFISEPDKGIYDAMNKGLQAATGKYVWFMNAGDEVLDSQVVNSVFSQKPDSDVIYGNAMYINDDGSEVGLRSEITPHKLPEKLTWQHFRFGMLVCHQAFIAKREMAPIYDLNHPYSADIDWEIKCLKNSRSVFYTGQILCKYLTGGFSKKHLRKSLKDRYQILKKHFGFFPNLFAHLWIILRGIFFSLRKIFSK